MQIKVCFWWMAAALMFSAAMALVWQRAQTVSLKGELDTWRFDAAESNRLEADHARLLARQIPDSERASLRDDRQALSRLRTQLQVLKLGLKKEPTAAGGNLSGDAPAIPAADWRNLGRATPAAALETVLWAGLNGNMDAMSAAFAFESESARAQARSLMASLPAEAYDHRGSPERLIALLTAKDATYDAMRILGEMEPDEETVRFFLPDRDSEPGIVLVGAELLGRHEPSVLTLAESPDGTGLVPQRETIKNTLLFMQRNVDGWKVLIPTTAVEHFATRLREDARP